MRRSLVALLAAACLALTSCGGSGSSGAGDPPSSGSTSASTPDNKTEDAARQVVEDYSARFFDGDMKAACALLTPEYQKSTISDAADFSDGKAPKDCEAALKAALVFAKAFGYDPDSSKVTQAKVSGDTATVLDESEAPFEDTLYTLNWDGSQWLIANDESAAEAKADPERWLANWCAVKPGMTVAGAVKLMGDFTGEFRGEDESNPQIEWSKGPYSFTAFLDTDGKIIQLDTNESTLGATDKAKLKCEPTRR